MKKIYEYEISLSNMRKLTQYDHSDEFVILLEASGTKKEKIIINTTINKARVISNNINDIYQIDPTVNEYTLIIPQVFTKKFPESNISQVEDIIRLLLKSTEEKIEIDQQKVFLFDFIRQILGTNESLNNLEINIESIDEAISYLNTDIHDKSIEYISSHLIEFFENNFFSKIDHKIVFDIIDAYFSRIEDEAGNDNIENNKKIFSILEKKDENQKSIVMHFLLHLKYEEYEEEMILYILSHLSDEIMNDEQGTIIEKFKQQLLNTIESQKVQQKKLKENVIECKFEGKNFEGIFYQINNKFGKNAVKLSDANTGSGSNLNSLITNDKSYYQNQGIGHSNESDGWFEIDFNDKKINLTSYALKTSSSSSYSFPKSWRIVGSNNKEEWEILSHQINNSDLNGKKLDKKI